LNLDASVGFLGCAARTVQENQQSKRRRLDSVMTQVTQFKREFNW
jgi:hypothetical protein